METWMSICSKDRFLSKLSPTTSAKTRAAPSNWNGGIDLFALRRVYVCLLLTSIFQILSGKRGSVSDSSNMQLWQFDLVRFCWIGNLFVTLQHFRLFLFALGVYVKKFPNQFESNFPTRCWASALLGIGFWALIDAWPVSWILWKIVESV